MKPPAGEASSTLVSLVTAEGGTVPVREFSEEDEASSYLDELAEVTGLPVRSPVPEAG